MRLGDVMGGGIKVSTMYTPHARSVIISNAIGLMEWVVVEASCDAAWQRVDRHFRAQMGMAAFPVG